MSFTFPPIAARRLPAKKTPMTSAQVYSALLQVCPELTPKSICVLLAQWALETGRGHSCISYNLGNIKSDGSKDHCYFPTWERLTREQGDDLIIHSTPKAPARMIRILPSGAMLVKLEPDHPGCRFLAFETLEAGALSYVGILRRRFTKAWNTVVLGDPVEFALAMKRAHYYTEDVGVYAKNMASLWREFMRDCAPQGWDKTPR